MKQPNNQHTDRFEIAKVCPVCGSCRLQRKFNVRHVIDDPQRACALELGFAGATVVACRECDLVTAKFPAQSFDVICSFDVLEHLPSPTPIFREARRILRPGGWLLLGTGDSGSLTARLAGSRWTYLCLPEHLSFFNSNSLRKGLAKAGFSVSRFERIHHGERSRSVATGWMRGVGKHWAIELFGENIIRLGLFRQKTTEFLVPYFFDLMICVAK